MDLPKDMAELRKLATEQGWLITETGSGHLKWVPPKGRAVITSKSPSDYLAIHHIRRDLNAAGLVGITPERLKPEPEPDSTNYFNQEDHKTKRLKHGALKRVSC